METGRRFPRRAFLKGSALGLAAVGIPTIIPAAAMGNDGAAAPSDRIVLGGIGVGRRGRYVL